MSNSARISPTAHYTGYVWHRHGMAPPELGNTLEGRLLYTTLRPAMTVLGALGSPTLEPYLLARHRAIDAVLDRALSQGIEQVLELASGLSPRGWRFTRRRADLRYIDADLPGMAARKRDALLRAERSERRPAHGRSGPEVREVDVLRAAGAGSVAALAAELEPERGLAVVTEGLLSYLPREEVEALWARLATTLSGFATGTYVSDLHLGLEESPLVGGFRTLLSGFVRGRVHVHYSSAEDAETAALDAGFARAQVRRAAELVPGAPRRAPGFILQAWTGRA